MKFPITKDISLEVVSFLCVCIGYRILKEEAICVGDSLISQTNIEQNVDRMYVCSETNHECSSWISE